MNKTTQEVARKAPRCALNVAASKPSNARGAAQGMINNGNVINIFLVLPHKVLRSTLKQFSLVSFGSFSRKKTSTIVCRNTACALASYCMVKLLPCGRV